MATIGINLGDILIAMQLVFIVKYLVIPIAHASMFLLFIITVCTLHILCAHVVHYFRLKKEIIFGCPLWTLYTQNITFNVFMYSSRVGRCGILQKRYGIEKNTLVSLNTFSIYKLRTHGSYTLLFTEAYIPCNSRSMVGHAFHRAMISEQIIN